MSFLLNKKSFVLEILFLVSCLTLEDAPVDLNDILSSKWMPGTLLEYVSPNGLEPMSNHSNSYLTIKEKALDGTMNNALDTMTFHRSMINQYLCRSYVANQILSEMTKNSLKRRMSDSDSGMSEDKLMQKGKLKPNIMLDQGSSSYENWLMKSSTLDDIYSNHKIDKGNEADMSLSKTEMEEMEIKPSLATKLDHDYNGVAEISDHTMYNGGQYGHQLPPYLARPSYYHVPHVQKDYRKGGEKLADLFEIALTALAYLSFGLFIVHLIMSICAVGNQTSTINTRIVAMNAGPAALIEDTYDHDVDDLITERTFESEEYKYRSIKTPLKLTGTNNINLNELAKKFLNVFDSALVAEKDGGQCLRNSLCNVTKYSRSIHGRGKLFMGLWCFGVSWLSDRLSNKIVSKTESLQAVLFGLGNANCDNIFKKCLREPV